MNVNVARVSGTNATKSISRLAAAAFAVAAFGFTASPAAAAPEVFLSPVNIYSAPYSSVPTTSTSATIQFAGYPAPEGGAFTCTLDSGTPQACTSPLLLSGLADGPHTLKVTQSVMTDPGSPGNPGSPGECTGSESSPTECPGYIAPTDPVPPTYHETPEASVTWTVDTTAPGNVTFSGTPAEGALTNSTSASIGVSADGSSEIRCSIDFGAYNVVGSTVELTGLGEGFHRLTCIAFDAAGNYSPAYTSRTWTIDLTAPAFGPQLYSYASASSTGSSDLPSVTNSRVAFFQFFPAVFGEDTFICSLDGAEYAPCTSPVDFADLTEGSHTFSVKVVDDAGNIGPATSNTWSVDLTAPAAPGLSGAPAAFTKATGATITFTGEDGATFKCSVDGGPDDDCDGVAGVVRSGLADGSYSVAVKQTDTAGNTGPAATASWTVDTVAPEAPGLTGVPSGLVNQTGASVSIAGEEGASFT